MREAERRIIILMQMKNETFYNVKQCFQKKILFPKKQHANA